MKKALLGVVKKLQLFTFSDKVVTSLKNKVKDHNEKSSKKVSLSQLKKSTAGVQELSQVVIALGKVGGSGLWLALIRFLKWSVAEKSKNRIELQMEI